MVLGHTGRRRRSLRLGHRPRCAARPFLLQAHQLVPRGAGAIVELAGRGHEQAAAGDGVGAAPAQPALEDRAHPRLAAGLSQGGTDDRLHEAVGGEAQDLDLQGLRGPEVGEEAALGEAQVLGQVADADAFEPAAAGQGGRLPLSHRYDDERRRGLSDDEWLAAMPAAA